MPLVIVAIFFIVLFSCEGIEHLCRESDDGIVAKIIGVYVI